MSRRFRIKPAKVAVTAALSVVVLTLGGAAGLLAKDSYLAALLVLAVGTHFLVLGALWFAYRANTRTQHLSRRATLELKEIQSIGVVLRELQDEIHSLQSREEFLHDLTRKRIRDKHDSISRFISRSGKREAGLHELTRKRLREKVNETNSAIEKSHESIDDRLRMILTETKATLRNKIEPDSRSVMLARNAIFSALGKTEIHDGK